MERFLISGGGKGTEEKPFVRYIGIAPYLVAARHAGAYIQLSEISGADGVGTVGRFFDVLPDK